MSFAGKPLDRVRRHLWPVLIACLVVGAFLLRMEGITKPSIASRELYGALLARQYYFGGPEVLPPAKQEVVRALGEVFDPIEPPVLNLAAALAFRLTGGENLWFPRLVPALLWVLGGLFLYLIAVRIGTRGGALVSLTLYLFWPFGVWISRHGMPDSIMVALLLAAAFTVLRYWERPSCRRLIVAGLVSSAATAAKPGVALIFLAALFVALAISKRELRTTLVRGHLVLFVVLASALSAAYYVYGAYARHFLAGESEGRLEPGLVATAWFWRGWWSMVSAGLSYPQSQTALALVPVAAAVGGFAVARRGIPRAVLGGLALGYLAFGLTFTVHIATHSYYSLPLIPILALSIGTLGGGVLHSLAAVPRVRAGLVAVFVAVIGVAVFKTHAVLAAPRWAEQARIDDYRRVGEVTRHTTRALVIDPRLISPISYWGWIVGRYWYEPTPEQDLLRTHGPSPPEIDRFDFLVVMEVDELVTERRLRAFVRDLPIVARTDSYAVFDLRGRRPIVAGQSSRQVPEG